jgi:hypothetical protein
MVEHDIPLWLALAFSMKTINPAYPPVKTSSTKTLHRLQLQPDLNPQQWKMNPEILVERYSATSAEQVRWRRGPEITGTLLLAAR